MKYAFIAEKVAEQGFPVRAMCRVLAVSPSGYYACRNRPKSQRERDDEVLGLEVAAAHAKSKGIYGSPRITEELKAQGRPVSRKRVARKMREAGLRGRKRRPFKATTDSKNSRNVSGNLLRRNFVAGAPNRVWVTDVTAIYTGTGWLYLAAILDVFSRAVVGWTTSATNDTALALAALRQAFEARRPPPGLIHHSDRGAPYASDLYQAQLKAYGMRPSMSRTGDCWDNAVAESFFASIKGEWLDHDWHPSRAAAHRAIAEYIDSFYNPSRRHSSIGYLSPDEFELRAHMATLAA